MFIIRNIVEYAKTKHISVLPHFIRDYAEKKLISIVIIDTDNNFIDLLTKGFDQKHFKFLLELVIKLIPEGRVSIVLSLLL